MKMGICKYLIALCPEIAELSIFCIFMQVKWFFVDMSVQRQTAATVFRLTKQAIPASCMTATLKVLEKVIIKPVATSCLNSRLFLIVVSVLQISTISNILSNNGNLAPDADALPSITSLPDLNLCFV